jgi:ABC-2 type transport system ATP-binding protein
MLSVRRVSKSFGSVAAVAEVSFEIGIGAVVGLLGPNGAGKTTTIRMITGMLAPDAGTIAVDGHDTIGASAAARRAIGYLPESAPAYPEMAVEDLIDFRASLYGMRRGVRRAAVARVLERCALVEVRRRRVGHLSKGYRQRVGLAAAMVHDPKVLVLDEPANGLDPTQIAEMRTLIRELADRRVVLVSSHILPEVEKTCPRVIVMIRGRVRADGLSASLVDKRGSGGGVRIVASRARANSKELAEVLRAACGEGAVVTTRGTPIGDGFDTIAGEASGIADVAGAMERVGKALLAGGWVVTELSPMRRTLESVFVDLLHDERGDEKGAA